MPPSLDATMEDRGHLNAEAVLYIRNRSKKYRA
eukprot:COSAG01_NODE_67141_length_268_cov_0.568047_1_plen_32_part_10